MTEHSSAWYFDFTRSFLLDYEIGDSFIRIEVEDFGVLGGYLELEESIFFERCTLIYEDVTHSTLKVSKYLTEDRQEFGKKYQVVDDQFLPSNKTMFEHGFSGISENLNAWIYWTILAASVRVECLETLTNP